MPSIGRRRRLAPADDGYPAAFQNALPAEGRHGVIKDLVIEIIPGAVSEILKIVFR